MLIPATATIRVASLRGDGTTSTIVKAVFGVAAALALSVAYGFFFWLEETRNSSASDVFILIFLAPIVVLALADFLMFTRRTHLLRSISRLAFNIVLLFATLMAVLFSARGTGSMLASISICLLGLVGAYSAFLIVTPQIPWTAVPGSEDGAAIGWNVFATFAAALVFLVTNAGLKLAGL